MRPCALLLVLAAAALMPASASAYAVGGHPWPGKTIRYHTAARGYAAAVDKAARNWNRAKVGVRFARSGRRGADVVVAYGTAPCGGVSPMGYGGRFDGTTVRLGAGCSKSFIVLTATHELGHVLGLDHESRRCARMNYSFSTSGTPVHCRGHSLSYWLERPLEPDDVRGAKSLYASGASGDGQPGDGGGGWDEDRRDHRH